MYMCIWVRNHIKEERGSDWSERPSLRSLTMSLPMASMPRMNFASQTARYAIDDACCTASLRSFG